MRNVIIAANWLPPLSDYVVTEYVAFGALPLWSEFQTADGTVFFKAGDDYATCDGGYKLFDINDLVRIK